MRRLTRIIPDAVCRFCHCTNERACIGGCGWIEPTLCSVCADILEEPAPLVYMAARYSRLDEMNRYADELRSELGYRVEARWLKGEHQVHDGALAVESATDDMPDVGRHVEFGIALAAGKRIFVVGPRENVFYCLPVVRRFDEWTAAAAVLATR